MPGAVCYGAEKAALERMTQGLAAEVFEDGISVTCLSPSVVVATPGTLYHHLVETMQDGEPIEYMTRAALLLVTEPVHKISGRVTYSQELLKEYGLIKQGAGIGFERKGSGYSQI
jgi:NAD(P)-dependent dehydrogenase (short-subunit alcohol dehydrogenase family)